MGGKSPQRDNHFHISSPSLNLMIFRDNSKELIGRIAIKIPQEISRVSRDMVHFPFILSLPFFLSLFYSRTFTQSLMSFVFPFAFDRVIWSEDIVGSFLSEGLLVVGHTVHVFAAYGEPANV